MSEQKERREQPLAENESPAGPEVGQIEREVAESSADLEALRQDLEEANRKLQEYLGLAQRTQADFVNYRRRVEAERGESLIAGKAVLAQRLLPALDDFDRALRSVPKDLAENDWVKGIGLVARKLSSALEAEGIVRIQALGEEFNPWEHEAMMHAPSSEDAAGKVVEVYREGYRQGEKVLRPAQVIVGKGSE